MRILILEDSSQALYGGGQKITKIVAEALKNDNLLFLVDYKDSQFVKDVRQYMDKILILNSGSSHNKFMLRYQQFINLFKNIFKIKAFISASDIDIIYATTKLTLLVAFVLNKLTGLPFVYHAHMAPDKKTLDRICVYVMRYAKAVLAVSKYVKDRIGSSKVNTLIYYNPIEYEIGSPKKLNIQQKIRVSFFGTLKKEKGVEDIVRAAEMSIIQNKNIDFLIFGNGYLSDALEARGLSNVIFMGHVDDVEEQLVKNTDVLILPSRIAEACPTIILQAMSKGNPIITTCLGGQKELVEDGLNGYLIPPREPQSLVDAICKLTSNPEFYNMMSVNNLEKTVTMPNAKVYNESISSLFKTISSN